MEHTQIKTHLVVLAAGFSRRLEGFNKLLLPCPQGGVLVEQTMKELSQLSKENMHIGKKYLVFSDKKLLTLAKKHDFIPIFNNAAIQGKSQSIVLASKIAPEGNLLFIAGDQFLVTKEHILAILRTAHGRCSDAVFTAHLDGTLSVPSFFSKELRPYLEQLSAEQGGKDALELYNTSTNSAKTYVVNAPYSQECDIDTWNDYVSFLHSQGKKHLLITGEKGIGKSTIITAIAKTAPLVDGLLMYINREESLTENNLYIERIKTGNKKLAARLNKTTKNVVELDKDSFNQFAVNELQQAVQGLQKLQNASVKPLLILDELGRIEKDCTQFLNAVRSIFNTGNVSIVATIQSGNIAFNKELLLRDDVTIL